MVPRKFRMLANEEQCSIVIFILQKQKVQWNTRHSLCFWDVDTLVFVERAKGAQVVEELIRAFYQRVLGIQDALEGTNIAC